MSATGDVAGDRQRAYFVRMFIAAKTAADQASAYYQAAIQAAKNAQEAALEARACEMRALSALADMISRHIL